MKPSRLAPLALCLALVFATTGLFAQQPDASPLTEEETHHAPGLAQGVAVDRPGLTAEQEARYQTGLRAYQEHRYQDAIRTYVALARDNTCCGVLGMVVASYASTAPSPSIATRFQAEADAAPGDLLKQFIAGVVSHYAAHHSGRSREEKSRLYEQCIRYLERTRPQYEFEPRLFIYLAVSNFRLGHQREAEALIERAVTLARNDPDAYYCRAEIFQRTNIQRSIDDIDTYLRMIAVFEARGARGDPGKTARVRSMREHLVKVSRGEASPTELFDPVQNFNQSRPPEEHDSTRTDRVPPPPSQRAGASFIRSPRAFGLAVLAFGALAALARFKGRDLLKRLRGERP